MMNPDDPQAAVRRRVMGGLMGGAGMGIGSAPSALPPESGGMIGGGMSAVPSAPGSPDDLLANTPPVGMGAAGLTMDGVGQDPGRIGTGPRLPMDQGPTMGGWDNPFFGGPGVQPAPPMGGGISGQVRDRVKHRLARGGRI